MAVSTTHQAADLGAQRIVTLRVFDGNIHRLGLLALCEAAVAIVGLYAAIFIRFAGSSATLAAFEASRGPFWPRALTIAGAFMVALAALGLYQLRQRTRFTAVFVRIVIALAVALEVFTACAIRDNLTLNVLNLIAPAQWAPLQAIHDWQAGAIPGIAGRNAEQP